EKFYTEKGIWEFVAPMNGPRMSFATTMVKDLLYAIGGFTGESPSAGVRRIARCIRKEMNYG
ncbi:hypothetical protein AVEN_146723-1, partial [Araneus ventricosus]